MGLLKNIPVLGRIVDLAYTMLLVIIISAIIGLILAWPVQLLWNFVFKKFPEYFQISVLQAWALNVLAGILFGKTGNGKKS